MRLFWMLVLGCVLGFCVAGCTSKDDDDDNETYATRDYIIGIGKWSVNKVRKPGGAWSDDYHDGGKYFILEFFDKKNDSNDRKFKSWEYYKKDDSDDYEDVMYEGIYTVDHKTITCTVDGQPHLRFVVTSMENRDLAGTVTFYKENLTFDVVMVRSW